MSAFEILDESAPPSDFRSGKPSMVACELAKSLGPISELGKSGHADFGMGEV
jgi:hypothetical protein